MVVEESLVEVVFRKPIRLSKIQRQQWGFYEGDVEVTQCRWPAHVGDGGESGRTANSGFFD